MHSAWNLRTGIQIHMHRVDRLEIVHILTFYFNLLYFSIFRSMSKFNAPVNVCYVSSFFLAN